VSSVEATSEPASARTSSQPAPPASPSPAFLSYLRRRRRERVVVVAVQLVLLVLVLVIWQVGARASWWDPILTSTPSTVWSLFTEMVGSGDLWQHVWATLEATLISFVISMLLGIAIATVLWWSPFVERVIDPYLVVLNAMPKIALGPILLVWLGASRSVYGMAIIISLIVTVIMTYTGFTEVDDNKVKVVRTFGGNKLQVFRKVILPGSIPTLLAAIKVNLGLTLVGVIVGEFLASKAGLGYLILYGSQIFRMSLVMMSIVLLAVLSALLYGSVMIGERLLFRRHGRR
jgi:NitT/TauT family transport system permease protein